MADLLKAQDIKEWLKKLPEWELDKKHIERTFEFDDFTQAMEFVNGVAEIAEEEDHHPDIDVRYNKCASDFRLTAKAASPSSISKSRKRSALSLTNNRREMAGQAGEEPTFVWKVVCALIVAAFVVAISWFISWRSAPPPPPPLPTAAP
jgi:pterin-4a-carbinolamine dehydratase